jgi:hypothetical protein
VQGFHSQSSLAPPGRFDLRACVCFVTWDGRGMAVGWSWLQPLRQSWCCSFSSCDHSLCGWSTVCGGGGGGCRRRQGCRSALGLFL